MYASLPSGEDSTSWGSGPAGTRPTILSVAGSTIASVLSAFSRTSRAGDVVCAPTQRVVMKSAKNRKLSLLKPEIIIDLISTPILGRMSKTPRTTPLVKLEDQFP